MINTPRKENIIDSILKLFCKIGFHQWKEIRSKPAGLCFWRTLYKKCINCPAEKLTKLKDT